MHCEIMVWDRDRSLSRPGQAQKFQRCSLSRCVFKNVGIFGSRIGRLHSGRSIRIHYQYRSGARSSDWTCSESRRPGGL